MLGGCAVKTKEEAATFTRLLVRPMKPVRVGDWIEEPPCIDLTGYEKRFGRPCPRVEVDAENKDLVTLFGLAVREDLRALGAEFFRDSHAHLPPEQRARALRRYVRALQDDQVVEALYPSRKES